MSESHFRRVFRELVGMGPLDYLNRTRIAKACSLLRMTDDSILTISEKVGFGSMSSFNRHFYEVMGTAPSDWRRAARQPHNSRNKKGSRSLQTASLSNYRLRLIC